MATSNSFRNNKTYSILLRQQKFIEKYYDNINCHITSEQLICNGIFQPNNFCSEYKVRITYKVGRKPRVIIIDPKIVYNEHIHLYKDGSLCLFYPQDLEWNDHKIIIGKTIIPWISEWIIFYEFWKINGIWLGKEVKHKIAEDEE